MCYVSCMNVIESYCKTTLLCKDNASAYSQKYLIFKRLYQTSRGKKGKSFNANTSINILSYDIFNI